MERNRNWPAWIALILGGLALFVALGGRGPAMISRWNQGPAVSESAPQAPVVPQAPRAPVGPELREGFQRGPGREFRFEHGPGAWHERDMMAGGHGFKQRGVPFFFGPLALLWGLGQLIGLGLLGWLLLRLWRDRHGANTMPPAPTTPAGHDPRVE